MSVLNVVAWSRLSTSTENSVLLYFDTQVTSRDSRTNSPIGRRSYITFSLDHVWSIPAARGLPVRPSNPAVSSRRSASTFFSLAIWEACSKPSRRLTFRYTRPLTVILNWLRFRVKRFDREFSVCLYNYKSITKMLRSQAVHILLSFLFR